MLNRNRSLYLSSNDDEFKFDEFLKMIGDEYENDNDIIQLIRNIRNEMDDLMNFSAPRLARDKNLLNSKS